VLLFGTTILGADQVSASDADFEFTGTNEDDRAGGVLEIGDLNGDLLPDLVVGAPGVDYGGEGGGAAYVIFSPG